MQRFFKVTFHMNGNTSIVRELNRHISTIQSTKARILLTQQSTNGISVLAE